MKKSSLGAREPAEDVKPAKASPWKPGRTIRTNYDPSEQQRSVITSPKPRNHDNPTTRERSGVRLSTSSSDRASVCSLNKHR